MVLHTVFVLMLQEYGGTEIIILSCVNADFTLVWINTRQILLFKALYGLENMASSVAKMAVILHHASAKMEIVTVLMKIINYVTC